MTAAQGALGLGIVLTLRDEASNRLKQLRDKVTDFQGVTTDMVERFDAGSKKILAGVGLIYGGAKLLAKSFSQPLAAAMGFQSGMAEVGTLIGGNVEQMKLLGDSALVLSAKYGKSANEIAAATYQAISAGVDAAKSKSFVDAASKMAVAGVTDTKIAVDGLTSAMKAYNRTEEEVMDISDSFFVAMKYGKTTVGELSGIMGKVASSAAQAKIPFDEMMAAVAAATLPGQATAEVGTGMVAVIKALVAPTSEAQKAAKELGLELNETALKSNGLLGMFQQLMEKTGGSQEKLAKLLGSTEAMKTMLNAMSGDGKNFINILDEMTKKSGATEAAFKTISETVQFKLGVLEHTFNAVRIKFGTLLLPVFGKIVDGLTVVTNWMNVLPQPVLAVVAAVLGFIGVGLVLIGVLMTVNGVMTLWPFVMKIAHASLVNLRIAAVGATRALSHMAFPILALLALSYVLRRAWENNFGGIRDLVTTVVAGFRMAVSAGTDGITKVDAATAKKLRELGLWDFAVTAGKVFFRVRTFFVGLVNGFKASWDEWKKTFLSIGEFLTPLISKGKVFLEFIGVLDGAAQSNSKTWKKVGEVIGGLVGLIAPVVVIAFAFVKTLGLLSSVISIFKTLIVMVKLFCLALAANPIGATVALVAAGIAYMVYRWDYFGAFFKRLWNGITQFFSGIWKMICGIWQGDIDLFKEGFTAVFDTLKNIVISWVSFVKGLISSVTDGINWVLEKLGFIDSKRHNKALAETIEGMGIPVSAKKDLMGMVATMDSDVAQHMNSQFQNLAQKGPITPEGFQSAMASTANYEYLKHRSSPQAAPLAASSLKGAAVQNAQAMATMAQTEGQMPIVQTEANVTIEPTKTDIYIDGAKVGEAVTRWQDKQDVRKGRG